MQCFAYKWKWCCEDMLTTKRKLTIIVHAVVKVLLHTKGKSKNQSWNRASPVSTELVRGDIGYHNGTADTSVDLTQCFMYMGDWCFWKAKGFTPSVKLVGVSSDSGRDMKTLSLPNLQTESNLNSCLKECGFKWTQVRRLVLTLSYETKVTLTEKCTQWWVNTGHVWHRAATSMTYA